MIYLARHGRTAYNRELRFQGRADVPLDDTGRDQAAELAELAAGHDLAGLWASPLLRARETAEIVAQRIGLPIHFDERLVETDAGDWTGRLFADIEAEDPAGMAAFLHGDPDFAFPGGESFADQGDRVAAALADVARGPLPALAVCHGVVIRLALARHAGERGPGERIVANGALVALDGDPLVELPGSATSTPAS